VGDSFDRLRAGAIDFFADAARRLGVTRARMSQVAALLLLPIAVQEDVLLGRTTATERALRAARSRVDAVAMPA